MRAPSIGLIVAGCALLVSQAAGLARQAPSAPSQAPSAPIVYTTEVDGVIHPVATAHVRRAIRHADEAGASLLVIFLRTPGGLVDSTRVGGATVVAAYSPRMRPGTPVSFPLSWRDIDTVRPTDFTVHNALDRLGERDPWGAEMPDRQHLSEEIIEECHGLPVARVQAMHEGKRRARKRRTT